ncbi:hypothetical protein SVIOM74S_00390 [Streptomyces violarus]
MNGLSRKHIMESCEASLRRLRTDYIDVYQAHRFDERTPVEETLVAFDDLVRQGKVLYLGVSEWTAPQIESALTMAGAAGLRSRIVSNQPQYSMLSVVEPEIVPLCLREGIGQLAFQPLAQGVLTGKYRARRQGLARGLTQQRRWPGAQLHQPGPRPGAAQRCRESAPDRRGVRSLTRSACHRLGAEQAGSHLRRRGRHQARAGQRERDGGGQAPR